MKCFSIRRRLSVFLDGMADADDTDKIIKHLQDCVHCRKEFEELRLCQSILVQVAEPELPEKFALDLCRRLGDKNWKA